MSDDFRDKVNRLEELAGKATQGEWLISTSDGIDWGDLYITTEERVKDDMVEIALIDNAFLRDDEVPNDFQKEQNANACYISAANPSMILEMIAELRRIVKADEDKHKIICEDDRRIENAEVKVLQLEKEADWLAEKYISLGMCPANGCNGCLIEEKCPKITAKDLREAARKAVKEKDNA